MRAWVSRQAGVEPLRLEKRERPRPGPGQVLLRMRAAAVALRDWKMAQGAYGAASEGGHGRVLGGEGVGEIAELGPGVEGWLPGQRVSPLFVHAWLGEHVMPEALAASSLGGLHRDGCMAEYMLADSAALVEVPAHLSDPQAAALPFAGLTAWCALRAAGSLGAEDWVVVQGTNGVMLLALQFALGHGAKVIVTSKSDEKLARARGLGAAHTINYQSQPEWAPRVREITGGHGASMVFDPGGTQTVAQSLAALRPGGTCAVVGALGASPELGVPLPWLLGHNLRVLGSNGGSLAAHRAMAAFVAQHCLEPVVERIWPFNALPAALEAAPKAEQFGKVVLQID